MGDDRPRVMTGPRDSADDLSQSTLARPALPDHAQQLAALDGEADAPQCLETPVALADVLDADVVNHDGMRGMTVHAPTLLDVGRLEGVQDVASRRLLDRVRHGRPRRASAACTGPSGHRVLQPRADLDKLSLVEHGDAIGKDVDDGEVVADEQGCETELPLQLGEELEYPCLHRHVEGTGGLVGDQQLGVERDAPRQAGTLTLTAREFVGKAVAEGLASAERRQAARPTLALGVPRVPGPPHARSAARQCSRRSVNSGLKLRRRILEARTPICSRSGRNFRSRMPLSSARRATLRRATRHLRLSPAIARPIVVLPDPLSPTRPSTSPGRESRSSDGY